MVAVVACLDTGRVQIGTGYLVTGRLVLKVCWYTADERTGRPARSLRVIRRSDGGQAPATASDVAVPVERYAAIPAGGDPDGGGG